MNVLICFMGKSGSGKDYISSRLGFLKMISSTTRKPRKDEVDGKDYYFYDMEEFDRKESQGLFAEVVEYNGEKYGFLKSELDKIKNDNCFAIVTPSGYRQLCNMLKDYIVVPVFLNTDDNLRRDKLINRHLNEDNIEFYIKQIDERIEQDKKTFSNVMDIKNIICYDVDYTEETTNDIIHDLKTNIVERFNERKYRKVIIDFDDVLVDTLGEACRIYNEENGTNLTVEDFKSWDVNSVANGFHKYFEKVDFENIPEKNNSIKWLREINKHYEVVIATASSSKTFLAKERWLNKNTPFINWKNIWCIRDKSSLVGCAIIDDGSHNIENSKCDIRILYDMPHNKNFTDCDLRVNDLEKVYNLLVKNHMGWE